MFVNTWDLSGRTSEEPATLVIMREATGDLGKLSGGNLLFTTRPAAKMLPSNAERGAGLIPGQGNKIPVAAARRPKPKTEAMCNKLNYIEEKQRCKSYSVDCYSYHLVTPRSL